MNVARVIPLEVFSGKCQALHNPGPSLTTIFQEEICLEDFFIWMILPIGFMYGICTYIYHKNEANVGKYTIHGSYTVLEVQ